MATGFSRLKSALAGQQFGLLLVILSIIVALAIFSPSHIDASSGRTVSNFVNSNSLLQVLTDTSLFAIMAVGMTLVILTGGIDLSVGSVYALAGVGTAMALESTHGGALAGLAVALGIGLLCGLFNGVLVAALKVHPFVVTLGTMWIFRGVAFVASHARSIPLPDPVVMGVKSTLGLPPGLYPIPALTMLVVTAMGWLYLSRTVAGRNIYAYGGSPEATRLAGISIPRVQIAVYSLCGLGAGLAAFIGGGYYGSASCNDATGYELYVIASVVVGGTSLTGGKGSALGALFGALLIILFRTAIQMFRWDREYEWIIIGAAVILAVLVDQISRRVASQSRKGV